LNKFIHTIFLRNDKGFLIVDAIRGGF